eukprot:3872250-Rhodomonas_salina.2
MSGTNSYLARVSPGVTECVFRVERACFHVIVVQEAVAVTYPRIRMFVGISYPGNLNGVILPVLPGTTGNHPQAFRREFERSLATVAPTIVLPRWGSAGWSAASGSRPGVAKARRDACTWPQATGTTTTTSSSTTTTARVGLRDDRHCHHATGSVFRLI